MGDRDTEKAFRWIVDILKKHDVPFQISGGLAAKIYGSKRPLNDIDIDIPESRFRDISKEVEEYAVFGPKRFVDDNWDLMLMTLNYGGQEIDIGGDGARVRDAETGEWREVRTDFSDSESHEVYGVAAPVIKRSNLIRYKRLLGRAVDIDDVGAITMPEQGR